MDNIYVLLFYGTTSNISDVVDDYKESEEAARSGGR